jgi:hypothetical protein
MHDARKRGCGVPCCSQNLHARAMSRQRNLWKLEQEVVLAEFLDCVSAAGLVKEDRRQWQ